MIQVFSNIIANAIDAMRQGGLLRIRTRNISGSTGDGVQTTIQDSGNGIQPEHLARIFEPFFTTKGDLGSGIGLWVAKQLVERRGGQISVTSSTERGKSGTSISIFMPFAIPVPRIETEHERGRDSLGLDYDRDGFRASFICRIRSFETLLTSRLTGLLIMSLSRFVSRSLSLTTKGSSRIPSQKF